MYTFSLNDICRAKTTPVEVKDDKGEVEGVIFLKEPSALAAIKLREKLISNLGSNGEVVLPTDNTQFMYDVFALTLCDASGNSLVNSLADQERIKEMPMRVMFAIQDTAMKMILGGADKKVEVSGEDIDQTLANLDDQAAKVYAPSEVDDGTCGDGRGVPADDNTLVAIPIDGNENLHLDQEPAANGADPTNPFVGTVEAPHLPV